MSTNSPTYAHAAFTASNFALASGSTSALSATLALSQTNSSITCPSGSNHIRVKVPAKTPVMLSLLQPTGGWTVPVNGASVSLTIVSMTVAPASGSTLSPDGNFDLFAVLPLPVPAGVAIGRVLDGHLFDLSYPGSGLSSYSSVLTWRYRNNLPSGPNNWAFTVNFLGTDNNSYSWDPTEEADH